MQFWPAIDLIDGVCVRLHKGEYASKKVYSHEPLEVAKQFAAAGATCLHVVDLSRAKDPSQSQVELISRLCSQTSLRVQVGGGIRGLSDCQELVQAGVDRIVIGSLAVKDPDLTRRILQRYPNTVIAMDVKSNSQGQFLVATSAWQSIEADVTIDDLIAQYPEVRAILCTDIDRDGCLMGPNFELYQRIKADHPHIELMASGGVRDANDLRDLSALGIDGAIVGKALYEGLIRVEDGVRC